ncbi:hypothetical protein [Scandinavium lactucae]|uniref:Uncharacterized protein n=1 Tax=Scandinavium lactucae TaxID=3095028 RepID=A0ABU4QMN2_9ENTR|nr:MULTISPECIES: hypothetical protein [unclassified Scandinavium]MDX6039419.1 hypothetical protein [Scandinavium sp. V105_6]MDX6048880.1 hypothetical protein [Scandinavium sp. V105_1]
MSEKTELEIAKLKLNSKDPVEREKAQQTVNQLREKDIASDHDQCFSKLQRLDVESIAQEASILTSNSIT